MSLHLPLWIAAESEMLEIQGLTIEEFMNEFIKWVALACRLFVFFNVAFLMKYHCCYHLNKLRTIIQEYCNCWKHHFQGKQTVDATEHDIITFKTCMFCICCSLLLSAVQSLVETCFSSALHMQHRLVTFCALARAPKFLFQVLWLKALLPHQSVIFSITGFDLVAKIEATHSAARLHCFWHIVW